MLIRSTSMNRRYGTGTVWNLKIGRRGNIAYILQHRQLVGTVVLHKLRRFERFWGRMCVPYLICRMRLKIVIRDRCDLRLI